MKLKTRLSLISSLVYGIVFAIASALVYFFYYKSSENLIYDELSTASRLTAYFYLEEDELTGKEHQEIEYEFQKILQKNIEVRVYNEENEITYGNFDQSEVITNEMLEKVRDLKSYQFRKQDHYYQGIFYPDNQGDFVIFVNENNDKIRLRAKMLLLILLVVMLAGLFIIILASRFVANIAYRPISKVIREVHELDLESLDKSLTTTGTRDELEELVNTFNDLLKRISDSFLIQKNFVNYVSHEFRTPLASISGNLEVFLQSYEKTGENKNGLVKEVIEKVHQIKQIMDTLMRLSGLRKEKIVSGHFRVDELLWSLLENESNDSFKRIEVDLEEKSAYGDGFIAYGDFDELKMAVRNILDNALKYSNSKPVKVSIFRRDGSPVLVIEDQGEGIPESDMAYIMQPFYRGSNIQDKQGSGIGLAIAGIILRKNKVDLTLDSKTGKGTQVTLIFSNNF
ncbi:MAG TPA: HAMP domain-containing sensor histidine kinase [Saprospiraceae bacterium]|nr:HAMP domain-containing sensor histidine kinase [Saprospiraceae bacterium]